VLRIDSNTVKFITIGGLEESDFVKLGLANSDKKAPHLLVFSQNEFEESGVLKPSKVVSWRELFNSR